jgi:acetylornithine deacetylase/succinyl-diaminopimelate desuccinylase-like protein
MIEGEEEVGSVNLKNFCISNKNLLKSDIIFISDTSLIAIDLPSITVGLRGLCYFEVEVTGPNRELHSGLYGGAVANPAAGLSNIIALLKDKENRITIPGFYNNVMEVSDEERDLMARVPFNSDDYMKVIDIDEVVGEKGYTTIERTGIRPSLDVCGMWSGYTGEGAKTIIPAKAYAKISMRLVPNQKSNEIGKLFEEYIKKIAPPGLKIKVTNLNGGEGYVANIDTKAFMAASRAMEESFGKKPIPTRSGGSIPIVSDFEEVLGVKSILMGFGLSSDAIHSPNENFPLFNFFKGIETIPLFYKYFAES